MIFDRRPSDKAGVPSFLEWLQDHKGLSEDYCQLISTQRGFDIREQYEQYLDEYHDWVRAGAKNPDITQ